MTSTNQSHLEGFLRDPTDGKASVDGLYDFRLFGGLYNGFCGDGLGPGPPDACAPPLAPSRSGSGSYSGGGSGSGSGVRGGGSGMHGSGGGSGVGSGVGSGAQGAAVDANGYPLCGARPDLRALGDAIRFKEEHHTLARHVNPDRFANFVDTHDESRVVTRCHGDEARAMSAVVTMMLVRGIPVRDARSSPPCAACATRCPLVSMTTTLSLTALSLTALSLTTLSPSLPLHPLPPAFTGHLLWH